MKVHLLWACCDSGFAHGNYHSPSVTQISFLHFPKYILNMKEKFIVCHTISWKLTYILCFTETLITKTFWISLWSMQKWHCTASCTRFHLPDFSLHSPNTALTLLKWTETRSPPRLFLSIYPRKANKSRANAASFQFLNLNVLHYDVGMISAHWCYRIKYVLQTLAEVNTELMKSVSAWH